MSGCRKIKEFEGYSVDSDGNVWSYWVLNHRTISHSVQRKLCQTSNSRGYRSVCLMKNGKRHGRRVNRLVCEAFHGSPSSLKNEAAHINGVRSDNRASNLVWKTRLENMRDMISHGTKPKGETHGNSKLTEKQVITIRKMFDTGDFSQTEIGRKFDLTRHQIGNIVNKKQWRHVHDNKENNCNIGG